MMAKKRSAKAQPAPEPATPAKRNDPLLDQMEGNFPPAFVFENEGDMIVGKVVGFSQGFSKGHPEYGPHPILAIQDEQDGETKSVHLLHTALRSQAAEANPQIGDRIAIKFIEKKTAKGSGREYLAFRVRVDQKDMSFADAMRGLVQDVEEDDLPF